MITQTLKLNLIPGQVLPRVNVSQYDAGTRTLQMLLYNGDQAFNIPVGYGGFVQGTKPDRTGFQYAATVTEGSNVVTLVVTQQMTAVSGEVTCELVIASGNDRIATVNFILYVEPAALADDTVISETELPLIEEAAELAQRIDGIAQQINEDAQTASNAATAATAAQTAAEAAADEAEEWGTHPPYIGANGNWYVYDPTTETYQDSGVKAQGPLSGLTDVEITNAQDGQEITYDGTTQKWKNTSKIQTLTNQVKDMNNVYGSKNLLPNNVVTTTKKGITFTVNDDGSITCNGTATDIVSVEVGSMELLNQLVQSYGTLILTGCPSGGSSTTYQMAIHTTNGYIYDRGDGLELTSDMIFDAGGISVQIRSGQTVSDLTFYPMIRLASIEDDTYEPYAKTNQQLTVENEALTNNINVNGSKNILPVVIGKVSEKNGGKVTVQSDGSYLITGTSTSYAGHNMFSGSVYIKKGTYVLSSVNYPSSASAQITIGETNYGITNGATTFELNNDSELTNITIRVGAASHNEVIALMLCLKSDYDLDPSYVPWAKTNQQLTQDTTGLLDNLEVNGAVNIAPNNATSQTINGITFTVNSDGSVTANGTATADAGLLLSNVVYPKGTYKKSGCPSGGSYFTYFMGGTTGNDLGDGATFTADGTTSYNLYCNVASGATVSNLTFKPMITVPSYNGDYVPYAKSNRELTEEKLSLSVLKSVVADSSDFADFKTKIAAL